MARTREAIKADMDAAKAAGAAPMGRQMRDLRAELQSLDVGSTRPDGTPTKILTDADAEADLAGTPRPDNPTTTTTCVFSDGDPFDSDEWEFIKKACAEVKIDADGVMTNVVKKVYNVLWAKLLAYRIARDIIGQIGVGKEWPQFAALGRDPSTGKKIERKPAVVAVPDADAPAPAPVPARRVGPVDPGLAALVMGGADPRALIGAPA